jgi:hypothetical protein
MTESNSEAVARALPTVAEMSTGHAVRRLRRNAEELRRLADDFDRSASDLARVPSAGFRTAVGVVSEVLHAHATWLANASLETAVTYAAEADVARAALSAAER